MFTFLLVIHAIIAAALVAVILMQRSEGGGLGMGGSPSGLMSARGAADFLTRATTVLAILFVLLSIGLAALATVQRSPREIDTSLARQPSQPVSSTGVPLEGAPLGNVAVPVAPAAPAVVPAQVAPSAPEVEAAKSPPKPATPRSAPANSGEPVVSSKPPETPAPAGNSGVPLGE